MLLKEELAVQIAQLDRVQIDLKGERLIKKLIYSFIIRLMDIE
jgi:hypothetical protein